MSLLLLVPIYVYALLLLEIGIHLYWLKKGKGEYHKKQLAAFHQLFDEYGNSIFFNMPAFVKTAQVAFSQQKMFYRMYSLKTKTESSLDILLSLRNKMIRKETLGHVLLEEDHAYKEKIDKLILDRQASLLEIKEQLGYSSIFVDGISENRISELKSYLKDI